VCGILTLTTGKQTKTASFNHGICIPIKPSLPHNTIFQQQNSILTSQLFSITLSTTVFQVLNNPLIHSDSFLLVAVVGSVQNRTMKNVCNVVQAMKPTLLMLVVQIAFAGVNIFYKLAVNDGMSLRVIVAYRFLFATTFIAPLALILERYHSWFNLIYLFYNLLHSLVFIQFIIIIMMFF